MAKDESKLVKLKNAGFSNNPTELSFLIKIQLFTLLLKTLEKLVKANKEAIFISKSVKMMGIDTPVWVYQDALSS